MSIFLGRLDRFSENIYLYIFILGFFSKTRVSHRVKMMTRWPGRERWPKWPSDPVPCLAYAGGCVTDGGGACALVVNAHLLDAGLITLPPLLLRWACLTRVCLSVCPHAYLRKHTLSLHAKFSKRVTRSGRGLILYSGVAIRYVLPVWWMASYLYIMVKNWGDAKKSHNL